MRVLMFSTDKTLLGTSGYGGDAQARHSTYGGYVDSLDIVVFAKKGFVRKKIADNVWSISTNSKLKFRYVFDAVKKGAEIIKNKEIDLIAAQDPHFTGLAAYYLSRKYKIPFTVNVHGDFFGSEQWRREQLRNRILYYLGKFIVKRADGVRVTSEGIKKTLIDNVFYKDNPKIYVIPTPVNLQKFQKFNFAKVNQIREKYQDKQIVLFVGRLVKAKNLSMLLEAAARIIKDASFPFIFLIIGNGDQEKKLKELAEKMHIQDVVDFIGQIDIDDLPNYYRACNFLVLPSTNESFGKVLLEAAMAEKSVIATNTTGANEILVDGKNGFIVPIGDVGKLAEKIVALLQNQNLAEQMGKENFILVSQKFEYEKNIKKIIDFWRQTIS